ncbi:MAG TPA: hypothetical protein VGM88_17895 [Kofleriaceae bacterium]|jgi:hypothetical protein
MRWAPLLLFALAACSDHSAASTPAGSDEPHIKLSGVYPEQWKCTSVMTPEAAGAALDGTVRPIDTAMTPPRGVPQPCNYEVTRPDGTLEYWTFDIDCRDGMKQRADALFAQYKEQSDDLVTAYKALPDAPPPPKHPKVDKDVDAMVPSHPPEPAAEVAVGAKGLDHHGQGILFIDKEAPCYVRVVGPDATRRLDFARLIEKGLTFDNAPMTPRRSP